MRLKGRKQIEILEVKKLKEVEVYKASGYATDDIRKYNVICCSIHQTLEKIKFLKRSKNKTEYSIKTFSVPQNFKLD